MASYEEARKCPKCEEPGEEGAVKPLDRRRGKLQQLWCRNPQCKWYNTSYTVQIRPDGSVPDPDTRPRTEGKVIMPSDEDIQRIQSNAQATLDGSLRGGELKK
jgi:hypothetical protein